MNKKIVPLLGMQDSISQEPNNNTPDNTSITPSLTEEIADLEESAGSFNKQLNEYLKYVKKEIGFAVQTLDQNSAKFDTLVMGQLTSFEQNITQL